MYVTAHAYAPRLSQPRHAHAEATFSIVLAGMLRERVGSREEIARPLSIVVKPPDTEHADDFGTTGVRLVRITLPADDAAHVLEWASAFRSWRWLHAGPASRPFLALVAAVKAASSTPEHSARVERLAWDTLAAILDDGQRAAGESPAWLARVREAIDDAAAPPRLRGLAQEAEVHPVHLARSFRRWFGCSVSGYVHRQRVRRAADLIARGVHPLSRVSLETGFTDQAHMCRIFRRETGLTPSGYRALAGDVSLVQDDGPLAA